MLIASADNQFHVSWPNNTTPQAPDGSGTSAATLTGFEIYNSAAAARFVKFFNKSSAPSMGTDTPLRTVQIPATSAVRIELVRGKKFTAGLWVSVTVNASDTDNTAPAANDVIMSIDYQ
jgi:hypothetical protein